MTSVQTGPEGVPVSVLLVAPGVEIAKEFYLGVVIDRAIAQVVMMASTDSGLTVSPPTLSAVFSRPVMTSNPSGVVYPTSPE